MTTAEKVLDALRAYGLKEEGRGRYRCNSPLRDGSDSMGFTITIDDGEHGTYHDHVSGAGGSLYDLAAALGIATPTAAIATLEEYAASHHVPAQVFRAAGWAEEPKATRVGTFPALAFPTQSGRRWRILGEYAEGKPKFLSTYGYKSCWYGLDRALAIARRDGLPLTLCNGEPSVIVAQFYGVAAACVTSGENKSYTPEQLDELRGKWRGAVVLAFDCDDTGRAAAERYAAQLRPLYDDVRAVDLGGGKKGYDLADFCGAHGRESAARLNALPSLAAAVASAVLPELLITSEQARREQEAIERIRKEAYWKGYHAGMSAAARELWRGWGATERLIDALKLGYDEEKDDMTIPFFNAAGEVVNIEYRQSVDPADIVYEAAIPALLCVQAGNDSAPVLLLPDSLEAIRAAQYATLNDYAIYALPHLDPAADILAPLGGRRVILAAAAPDERVSALRRHTRIIRLPAALPDMVQRGMTAKEIRRYLRQAG